MKRAIKNRRKGMTLIELIVGFALVAILSAALVGIIAPVYRTYQRTRAASDAQALAGNIIDTIRTSANSASVLSASDNTVTVGVVRYFVPEKPQRLMYEVTGKPAKPVFDEMYYDGKTITMTAKQPNPNVQTVEVTINVTTKDGVTVSQSGVISTMRQYIKGGYDIIAKETETPIPTTPGLDELENMTFDANNEMKKAVDLLRMLDSSLGWYWAKRFTTPRRFFELYYFNWSSSIELVSDYPPPGEEAEDFLTEDELTRLHDAAEIGGRTNAENMYGEMLDVVSQDGKMYYGVYFAQNAIVTDQMKSIPIVYVTPNSNPRTYELYNTENRRSPYAKEMYFVYFKYPKTASEQDCWYIRNPDKYNANVDWAVSFDGKDNKGIYDYLNRAENPDYLKLKDLQIPVIPKP